MAVSGPVGFLSTLRLYLKSTYGGSHFSFFNTSSHFPFHPLYSYFLRFFILIQCLLLFHLLFFYTLSHILFTYFQICQFLYVINLTFTFSLPFTFLHTFTLILRDSTFMITRPRWIVGRVQFSWVHFSKTVTNAVPKQAFRCLDY